MQELSDLLNDDGGDESNVLPPNPSNSFKDLQVEVDDDFEVDDDLGIMEVQPRRSDRYSNSQLENMSLINRVSLAAIHMNASMRGDGLEDDSYFNAFSPIPMMLYWWYVSRMWFTVYVCTASCHLLLAFIENPSNLEFENLATGPFSPGEQDLGLDVLVVHNQHSHRSFEWSMLFHSLELLFVAVYIIDLLAYRVIIGPGKFYREGWVRAQLFTVTFIGLNTLYCLIITGLHDPKMMKYAPQISRLMRPAVLLYKLQNVRRVFESIMLSVPHILNVLVMLVLMMIIFGALFFTTFAGIDLHTCNFFAAPILTGTHNITTAEGLFTSPSDLRDNYPANKTVDIFGTCDQYTCFCSSWGQNCTNYFNSITNTLLHLFIMLTTANFPDIMIPVSQCAWPFTLLFMLFMTMGLFFILNLLLAVVYNEFQKKAELTLKSQLDHSQVAAKRAFDVATKHGDKMELKMWLQLSKFIRTRANRCCSGVRMLPEVLAEPMFKVFEQEDGVITEEQFANLLQFASVRCIMHNVQPALPDMEWAQMDCKRKVLHARTWCKEHILDSKAMEYSSTGIILFYIIFALAYMGLEDEWPSPAWEVLHWLFIIIFLVEIAFRMFVEGPGAYFYDSIHRSARLLNIIDFIAVAGSCLVDPISYADDVQNPSDSLGKAVVGILDGVRSIAPIFRVFRVLRMLQAIKFYETQLLTMRRMLSPLLRYVGVICCLMYFFGTLTMELFAGKLDAPKCANLQQQNCFENLNPAFSNHTSYIRYLQVAGTSYAKGQFWTYNFNTIHMSITILFQQLVVNNWPVIMEGLMVAFDEQPGFAHHTIVMWRTFVVSFFIFLHLFQVMIFLNVLVAFLVDAYQSNFHEITTERAHKDLMAEWRQRLNTITHQVYPEVDISKWIIKKKQFSKSLSLFGDVTKSNEQLQTLNRRTPRRSHYVPSTDVSAAAAEIEMAEADAEV